MRLSIFYDHLQEIGTQKRLGMPEILAQARQCGIDGVELHLVSLLAEGDRILPELAAAGLCVSSVYETYAWGDGAETEPGKSQIDAACQAGADRILIVPGFLPEAAAQFLTARRGSPSETAAAMEASEKIRHIRTALRQAVSYGKSRGVTVTLEDYDGRTAPYAAMNQLLWWVRQVDGLRITLDTGNFAFSDEDAWQAYRQLRPYIAHVHAKDRAKEASASTGNRYNHGLAPSPVGSGYMPIAAIVKDLKATGYDGFLAIEHFGAADQLEFMRRSAKYLNAMR